MNAPDPFESFRLEDGEAKITYEPDSKVPNAGTFRMNREDHTVGNLLASQLAKDPRVLFAGYKVPHPLEHYILLRVHTTAQYSPKEALKQALHDVIYDVAHLQSSLREQLPSEEFDNRMG
ncbi:uncharacterized protein MONBRDRAFT_32960 [Monosiga brevicollis MX1]|uniref:DNA-directed RNA polymerase RBP11-like dimerisation domain-containing protein n=1 Tax=Monosiga brevicollis TaxID=81824 RepID=A9V2R7_MONBE|nr:uncharacterized protein MONBRDRAFT_32960 [Monosiga brevicollis MX1]EDQ88060.1 predicted protein [Monosiga brevicollis MX1]|eukprot:XP_001747136.1 hypothetical protein [Monosiga brevicollis MX1]